MSMRKKVIINVMICFMIATMHNFMVFANEAEQQDVRIGAFSENEEEKVLSLGESVIDEGKCGEKLYYKIISKDKENKEREVIISGTGDMYDYKNQYDTPFSFAFSQKTTLTMEEGITRIGSHAFDNSIGLNGNLNIPATVKSIGEAAFMQCRGFTGDLIIPDSVTEIEDDAFVYCNGFDGKLVLSSNLNTIGNCAFQNCLGITGEVTIPITVSDIGYGVFCDCRNITKIAIESDNCKIGEHDAYGFAKNGTVLVGYYNTYEFTQLYKAYTFEPIDKDIMVFFDSNGGETSIPSKIVKYWGEYGALPIPQKEHCIFNGWYYNETPITSNSQIMKENCDHTLIASWSPIQYNIRYISNSANESEYVKNCQYGMSYEFAANSFIRQGYVFKEWNTKSDGSGTTYKEGESFANISEIDGDTVSIYAIWSPITYQLKFEPHGATSGEMQNQIVAYDEVSQITPNAFIREGYTFKGWNTVASGSGVAYDEGAQIFNLTNQANKIIVLYAQWEKKDWQPDTPSNSDNTIGENTEGENTEGEFLLDKPVKNDSGVITWDIIEFGKYNNEPIQWRVLWCDKNDAFIMADNIITKMSYGNENKIQTWDESYVRTWLNSYFIDNAFTADEKKIIMEVNVNNHEVNLWGAEGGNDTIDKIYLLSQSEITDTRYGFATNISADKARSVSSAWWLRTSGQPSNGSTGPYYSFNEAFITETGVMQDANPINTMGVRPVMHIDLDSAYWKYAGVIDSDGKKTAPDASYFDVKIENAKFSNDIHKVIPQVVFKDKKLVEGRDYTLKYSDNYNVPGAIVELEITGINKYSGSIIKRYNVECRRKVNLISGEGNEIAYEINLVKGEKITLAEVANGIITKDPLKVAAINKKGVIKAKKEGESTIIVNKGDVTYTLNIKVYVPRFTQKKYLLSSDEELVGVFDNCGFETKYEIKKKICAVTEDGKGVHINALLGGTTKITAYVNGKKYSCTVKVLK